MTHIDTTNVQDIWFKTQRVLRTIVAVGIPAFISLALVLPQIIEALGLPLTSELYAWLVGVAAGVTAVAGAITRVMAIPAVNSWLVRIGLGSVPRAAVTK
jgi:predicted naringenin-chalcone synthase